MTPLRLVFMGSDPIALPLLNWIAGEGRGVASIVGVFTQPDRPAGRGQKVVANGIKTWALERGLPVHQPEKFGEPERQILADLAPDLSVVMAYGHILKDAVIATPRRGTVNLHTSLLPAYRGASPIQTAVAQGERTTGVTLMRIVRELDAGPIFDAEHVPIHPTDTALDVEAKLSVACVPLVSRNLAALGAGTLPERPQDHGAATFCRRLVKEDGVLDFTRPAAELAARINGLFPWPGCSVEIAGQPVKFGQATVGDSAPGAPGTVAEGSGDRLRIATGQGALEILRLQRPGGRMLSASDFLRGFPVPAGTILPSKPMPALVAPRPFR